MRLQLPAARRQHEPSAVAACSAACASSTSAPTIASAIPNVYAQWYGESHEDLAHLAQAVYGLPEVYGDEIATAQLVANPGCYPQTAHPRPGAAGGRQATSSRTAIIVDSKSGVSGAGRTPKLPYHFPECNESVDGLRVGSIATRRRSSRR